MSEAEDAPDANELPGYEVLECLGSGGSAIGLNSKSRGWVLENARKSAAVLASCGAGRGELAADSRRIRVALEKCQNLAIARARNLVDEAVVFQNLGMARETRERRERGGFTTEARRHGGEICMEDAEGNGSIMEDWRDALIVLGGVAGFKGGWHLHALWGGLLMLRHWAW